MNKLTTTDSRKKFTRREQLDSLSVFHQELQRWYKRNTNGSFDDIGEVEAEIFDKFCQGNLKVVPKVLVPATIYHDFCEFADICRVRTKGKLHNQAYVHELNYTRLWVNQNERHHWVEKIICFAVGVTLFFCGLFWLAVSVIAMIFLPWSWIRNDRKRINKLLMPRNKSNEKGGYGVGLRNIEYLTPPTELSFTVKEVRKHPRHFTAMPYGDYRVKLGSDTDMYDLYEPTVGIFLKYEKYYLLFETWGPQEEISKKVREFFKKY